MKICITTVTTTDKFTGVALYLQKLINNLQEIDQTNQYVIITTKDNHQFFEIKRENFKELRLPFNQRTLISRSCLHIFNIFFFPLLLLFYRIRVVHYPNTMFITRFTAKTVITIHDIVDQKVNKYGRMRKLYRGYLIRRSLKHADEIITVSQNSKKDLVELGNRNINMIYNGYELQKAVFDSRSEFVLNKYSVAPQAYFIAIGTLLKHKNVSRLVRIFSQYQAGMKSPTLFKLLIIGHKENDYENIVREIERYAMQDRIMILDYISEEEKTILLKNAFAFVFFSLYEGFGFPILEAQDLGVPVIILDTSCLKEISGDYALVLPNHPDDSLLTEKLTECCAKLTCADQRQILVRSARRNIYRFNWTLCARYTHSLYEKYNN